MSRSRERSALFLKYKTRPDLDRYRYFRIDMNDGLPKLLRLLDEEKPDIVVNFAAQSEVWPSWDSPEDWYRTNCVALAILVNHLRKQSYLERYVHISSSEVYGTSMVPIGEDAPLNPSTPYAASKAAADLLLFTYARTFGFPLVVVRGTNVYGARQQLFKLMPRCVIYLRLGKELELSGGGVARKAFINIRDVSCAEVTIMQEGEIGGIYHISPDRDIAVYDVVRTICDRFGRTVEECTVETPGRKGEDAAYRVDSSKTRQLGWRPTIALDEGLDEIFEWVDEYWDEILRQSLVYEHRR